MFQAAVDSVEEAVIEKHGDEAGKAKLAGWKEEEAEFKRNVVNFKTHHNIKQSPYDLPRPAGECQQHLSYSMRC